MDWIIQEAARRQTLGVAGTITEIAATIRAEALAAQVALYPPAPPPAPTDVIGTRIGPGLVVEMLADGTERTVEP